jgi:CheY-like chemotaxis protein
MLSAFDVLVVEDEAVVIESVKRILTPEGFSVDATGSSEEATQMLQQGDYGIILVDIVLPGVSGLQLIELLRKSHPPAITIMISGLATRENVIESFRCGAFDFIPKPFSFEELLGPVRRAVDLLQRDEGGSHGRDRAGGGVSTASERPSDNWRDYRFLGDHIWAKFEEDGSAVIGVDDTFSGPLGEIESVEFPGAFEEILQGHVCVRMTTKEKNVHVVWCAISGVVVESNSSISMGGSGEGSTGIPYYGTWLVRVWPHAQENEIANLKCYNQL